MSRLPFPEPATQHTLAQARREVAAQRSKLLTLSTTIQTAEDDLERLIKASRCAIQEMDKERTAVEDRLAHTLAYLAPIRRLPNELLSHIFAFVFDDLPCYAWVLSAVSSLWRRRVLAMPKLWSKVRLLSRLISTFRRGHRGMRSHTVFLRSGGRGPLASLRARPCMPS